MESEDYFNIDDRQCLKRASDRIPTPPKKESSDQNKSDESDESSGWDTSNDTLTTAKYLPMEYVLGYEELGKELSRVRGELKGLRQEFREMNSGIKQIVKILMKQSHQHENEVMNDLIVMGNIYDEIKKNSGEFEQLLKH